MRKKLLVLTLALAATAAAAVSKPAAAIGCGWVCSGPGCCVYCCTNQPCALPICDF